MDKASTIILSDLDGTLFRNDKSISDYSKKIIKEVQKKGLLFGISTSRALVNAQKFLDGISPDILITNGGGMVFYKGQKIYNSEFSVQEVHTLIKAIFDTCGKDAILSLDNESGLYSNSQEELGDKFWTYDDFSNFNEPAMKICVESLDLEKIEKIACCVGLENVDYLPFSDIPWYKLSKKTATKEKAIEALCSYLKIEADCITAFGDDFNDIGMLKLCGRGIAMENAIKEVKEAADLVCPSNEEDGLAQWLEKSILSCTKNNYLL